MLAGCSGSDDMTDPSDISADVLYLYDVKNGAIKSRGGLVRQRGRRLLAACFR